MIGCKMAAWWRALALALSLGVRAGGARELDPAACGARFDVQRDKIIRTEESREMGARYLSELDVGARHECLRLCCETDSCDVFVYEEKSPGSCYLFKCGPPEDFRCKFTAHGASRSCRTRSDSRATTSSWPASGITSSVNTDVCSRAAWRSAGARGAAGPGATRAHTTTAGQPQVSLHQLILTSVAAAALALSRRLAELQDQERLARHDQRLASLSRGALALSRRLAELQDQERLARHDQQLASPRVYSSGVRTSPASGWTIP
ncbi:hypothetical protein evm_010012 [Chilo suppressalis]|nr:hypothetical protein evm_010012 [Chilo suppressalis]